jgi:hypothetical protein
LLNFFEKFGFVPERSKRVLQKDGRLARSQPRP